MTDELDDALLADLRRSLEIADPVPDSARELGRLVPSIVSLDVELAELFEDELATRADETSDLLFRTEDATIAVIFNDDDAAVVDVMAADFDRVEVKTAAGHSFHLAEAAGLFEIPEAVGGVVRVVVNRTGHMPIATDWFSVG